MEPEPLLLGLDVGTSRTKAVIVDRRGRELRVAATPTPFATDGGVEMGVGALRAAVREVVAAVGDDRRRVAAVGVAGMAESGAPFDGAGRALAPVIGWHDGRGQEAIDELERAFAGTLSGRVGQRLRPVMTVAKLGWLVAHGVAGIERWLGVPELVLSALTGAESTEHSLAARTGCYDVGALEWIPEVATTLGFGIDVFPPVAAAGETMGRVSAEGAAWCGLPEGVPVTVVGHDHLAGLAGAGVAEGEVANSVGTAETLVARSATLPDVEAACRRRVAVTVHPGAGQWAALVSCVRAGIVIDGGAALLGRSATELDEEAGGAAPADAAHLVDPLLAGERPRLPDAPAGEIWAGLLGALAARTADAYRRLSDVVGEAERVVVFGGGSVSGPWLAAKAEALPVPVRPSPVASAVGRGAALYAGMAAGWWPTPPRAAG